MLGVSRSKPDARSAKRQTVALQDDGAAHAEEEGDECDCAQACVAPIDAGVHFAD